MVLNRKPEMTAQHEKSIDMHSTMYHVQSTQMISGAKRVTGANVEITGRCQFIFVYAYQRTRNDAL